MATPNHITLLNPPTIRKPRPTYSQMGITTIAPGSKLVTISGQVGCTRDGYTPSSFTEQANLTFENLFLCLEAAGARVQDIIKLTFYIVDLPTNGSHFSAPLQNFLTDPSTGDVHRPPSSLIGVKALSDPQWLLEVEATAVIPPPPSPPKYDELEAPVSLFSGFLKQFDYASAAAPASLFSNFTVPSSRAGSAHMDHVSNEAKRGED